LVDINPGNFTEVKRATSLQPLTVSSTLYHSNDQEILEHPATTYQNKTPYGKIAVQVRFHT